MDFKSKIIKKEKIDWDHKIVIDELFMDPIVLQSHTERVKSVFKNLSPEQQNQQINNIVVRDNIFNKAMDYLSTCYEIEFNQEDIDNIVKNIEPNLPENLKSKASEIANKLIVKSLIFNDIQNEYNITVSDEELLKILNDYYKETNMPIKDFMENQEKFINAKKSLLDEKITHFIIDRFPRDLSGLEKKLYESLQNKQEEEAAKKNK